MRLSKGTNENIEYDRWAPHSDDADLSVIGTHIEKVNVAHLECCDRPFRAPEQHVRDQALFPRWICILTDIHHLVRREHGSFAANSLISGPPIDYNLAGSHSNSQFL